MKKIVFEKKPAELKFVGVEHDGIDEFKAVVVKDYDKEKYRLINLYENENLPAWTEKTLNEIISESKKHRCHAYSFTSNTNLVNWAMGDDSVQKFPILETTDTIHIDEVTDKMFVGIVWNDGKKSFCLNAGSLWISKSIKTNSLLRDSQWSTPTLKDYVVHHAKKIHLSSAYAFPTAKELLQWAITN